MAGMMDPTSPGGGGITGLLGNLFGGNDPNALYSGLLSDPATKRALAMRELAAAAGAAGEAAMPTRMPTPIGAVLGKMAGAMGTAGDAVMDARLKAAQTGLYGYQGQQIQSLLQMRKAFADELAKGGLLGTPGGDAGTVPGAGGQTVPTTGGAGAPAVSSMTADTSLPTEARALLDTIAGPESAGAYNVRYNGAGGDATFDSYGAHPQVKVTIPKGQPYAGSTSDAAGRYQFLSSTFNPLAKQYGYTDFSPVTQDRAAWQLAQDTYAKGTGRNLLADLQSGDTSRVAQALHGQWGTLNMGAYAPNLAKYAAGAQPTQLAQAATGTATDAVPTGLLGPQPAAAPAGSAWSTDQWRQWLAAGKPRNDPRFPISTQMTPGTGPHGELPGAPMMPATPGGTSPVTPQMNVGMRAAPPAGPPSGLLTPGGANPLAVTGSAGIPQSLLGTLYPGGVAGQGSAAAPQGAPGGPQRPPTAPGATPVAQTAPAPAAPPSAPAAAMPPSMPGQLTPAQLDHIQKLMIYGKLGGLDITDVLSNTPQYKAAVAGASSAATAAATQPYDFAKMDHEAQVKAQFDLWQKGLAPQSFRNESMTFDPMRGQWAGNYTALDPQGNEHRYILAFSQPGQSQQQPVDMGITKLNPATTNQLSEGGKKDAEDYAKVNTDASTASLLRSQVTNMRQNVGQFYSGTGAPYVQDLNLALVSAGMAPDRANSVARYEQFVKDGGQIVREAAHGTSSRAGVQELKLIGNSLPSPEVSQVGLDRTLGELQGVQDFNLAKQQAMNVYTKGGYNNHGFEAQWNANVSPYAFIFLRMSPQDQQMLTQRVAAQQGGAGELQQLQREIDYIKTNNLRQP